MCNGACPKGWIQNDELGEAWFSSDKAISQQLKEDYGDTYGEYCYTGSKAFCCN